MTYARIHMCFVCASYPFQSYGYSSYLSSAYSSSSYPSMTSYSSTYDSSKASSSAYAPQEPVGSYTSFLQQSAERMAGIAGSTTPFSVWGQQGQPPTQHPHHPHHSALHQQPQHPPWASTSAHSPYSTQLTDPLRAGATPQRQLTELLGSKGPGVAAKPSVIAEVARDKSKSSPHVSSRANVSHVKNKQLFAVVFKLGTV